MILLLAGIRMSREHAHVTAAYYRVTQSPQFESYRTLDVVQLLVSGACFGAALTGLIVMLLRPRR
jgi:hypothetical protein